MNAEQHPHAPEPQRNENVERPLSIEERGSKAFKELFELKGKSGRPLQSVEGNGTAFSFVRWHGANETPLNINVFVRNTETGEKARYQVDERGVFYTANIKEEIPGFRHIIEEEIRGPQFLLPEQLKEFQVMQSENMLRQIKEILPPPTAPVRNT